jgi:DNA-binding transcriptional LysR family regulator
MIASAAEAGVGLARIPAWLAAPALRAGALVKVFDEPKPFGYEVLAVWPSTRYLPLKTRLVVDLLLEKLPPLLAD